MISCYPTVGKTCQQMLFTGKEQMICTLCSIFLCCFLGEGKEQTQGSFSQGFLCWASLKCSLQLQKRSSFNSFHLVYLGPGCSFELHFDLFGVSSQIDVGDLDAICQKHRGAVAAEELRIHGGFLG